MNACQALTWRCSAPLLRLRDWDFVMSSGLLIALLVASSAAPALAQSSRESGRANGSEIRSETSGSSRSQAGATETVAVSAAMSSEAVAAEIDRLIEQELSSQQLEPLERLDSTQWARRAFFDIVGRPPTPDELLVIQSSDSIDRAWLIDTLLADPQFGQNWGRYWRDAIFYRRSEERAMLAALPTAEYFTESLNSDKSWGEVATEMIVASGDASENGRVGLIVAQQGRPEETVSEISRLFLGIQIQCAQCHDHPTDRWTREQFHELAAFFPRVASRPNPDPEKRTINVTAQDRFFRQPNREAMNRFVGSAEHMMPDLDDPAAPGTQMQPIFFVNGESLPIGSTDAVRRGSLAQWLTAEDNEWFAKAAANRVWSELMGRSFYDVVDDIGPDREARSPAVLQKLAEGFSANNYSMKWLIKTVALTDLYSRVSIEPRSDDPGWIAPYRVPLRSDQLFDRMVIALQVDESALPQARRGPGVFSPRTQLATLFGFDPSDSRGDWAESIPQSLFLMNGQMVDRFIRSDNSLSARLVAETSDANVQIDELYVHSLSRLPSDEERSAIRQHLGQVSNRREALEDVHWSLLNTTEFLHRD